MERTTMGELANWEPPPDEETVYTQFVNKIDEIYPEDWRSWIINCVDYEDLFGSKISSDDECRLRFAMPTVQLAYVFCDNTTTSLSERKYKTIKRKLINWPIGRALIYAPFATMKKIHPIDAFNGFYEFLPTIKPQLISQTEASRLLKSRAQRSASPSSSTQSYRKRPHSPKMDQNPRIERLERLMEQQTEILQQVLHSTSKTHPHQNSMVNEPESSNDSEDGSWAAPPLTLEERGPHQNLSSCEGTTAAQASSSNSVEELFNNFNPETKESEAKVGDADASLAKQGIQIQRLNSEKWKNIRYADVQKHFTATPVFTSLKVNSSLASTTPPWQMITLLENMDQCLAAVSHGLLQQRECFMETFKNASLEVKSHISKNFLGSECHFRKTSDALLQYTCGKRAEILQHRRSVYKPTNKTLNELLHSIPPSATHLFSEPQLSDLIKEQGGPNKFFPAKQRNHTNSYKPRPFKTPVTHQETRSKTRTGDDARRSNYRQDRFPGRFSGKRPSTTPTAKAKKTKFEGRKY